MGDGEELRSRLIELEREHAELQAAVGRYRVLAEHSTAGIWHIRPSGETLFANPAMCQLLEVDGPEALRQRSAYEFFTGESRDTMRSEHAQRVDGVASTYEVELVGDRGTHRRVVIAGAPIRSESDGALESLIGTFTDVTKERLATEELSRARTRLELALDTTGTGLFEWDVVNDQLDVWYAGKVLTRNTSLETALLASIHPEHQERIRCELRDVLADSERTEFNLEYQIATEGGTRWRASTCRVLRDGEGQPLRVLGASVDLTEKKELERRLASAERLDSLGRLAGGIAHDFNNLLTVIVSSAACIQTGGTQVGPGLEEIREAADRAARLTRQLLAFARCQPLDRVPVDLGALLESSCTWLTRVLGGDVELTLHVATESPTVLADPSQLEQIIMNLATNARDALVGGGELRIEVQRMGTEVVMVVTDDGVGMDERTRERAFEPFFTTKPSGTGLGLATAYGVIAQLGGQMSVRSEPTRGTTVEVRLPAIEPIAHQPVSVQSHTKPRSGGERLLVVDDEPAVRRVLCHCLREEGYQVVEAPNGNDALDRVDDDVALLVTDVRMPGMSGRELADRVRAKHPSVRVLFVSGFSDDEVATAPGTAFLAKPFDPDVLSAAIRTLLDAGRRE